MSELSKIVNESDCDVAGGGATDVNASEGSVTAVPTNAPAEIEVGDVRDQTMNVLTPVSDGEQLADQGSTGPRTEFGKRRSSQNAVKSGIFAQAILIKGESYSEYQSLLEGLRKSLKPVGEFEELLVEKLLTNLWRLRRSFIAETAEIHKNSEFLEFDQRRDEQMAAEEISRKLDQDLKANPNYHPKGLIWNIQNPEILKHCIEVLSEIRRTINRKGLDLERDDRSLRTIYDQDHHLGQTLREEYSTWCFTSKASEKERQSKGYANREECKEKVLETFDIEIARLKQHKEDGESTETKRRRVEILRQNVPASCGLDRLLRYESTLERAFDRTLTQLERVQRMRKGQPLPPQVDVKIS